MTSINSPRPPPSTSRTSSLAQTPSSGITAENLPGLLDSLGIKPESASSDGKPTYKLDRQELGMLLKNPAVKSDMASSVMAMMDSSGPIIELEPDAAAIVAWHLGREAALPGLNGDSNAPLAAFTELIKPFAADQKHGEHYQGQMQDFYDAGKGLADMPEFGWPGGR